MYHFRKRDRAKGIAAYQRAVAIDSFNVDALNTLANLYYDTRNTARMEALYRRALAVEPENGILFANLISTMGDLGKFGVADSLFRVMRERKIPFPTDRLEAELLYVRGELDSAEARARRGLGSTIPGAAESVTELLRLITEVRGRLHESDSIAVAWRARQAAQGMPVNVLGLPIRMSLDDAWLRGRPERAIARLDSALRAHPLTPASPAGAALEAAHAYALAGHAPRARAILGQLDAWSSDSVNRSWWDGQREWAEGAILLAEKRTDDAIRMFRLMDVEPDGLPIVCGYCMPAGLARAYDQANVPDSTIANIERYLANRATFRFLMDSWALAPFHKRLGELYEARGDVKRAAAHYAAFVELWKRADPDLQPKVAEVRVRLERLRRAVPQ
jgi:tetratricopeptide (TPR) repeat protein